MLVEVRMLCVNKHDNRTISQYILFVNKQIKTNKTTQALVHLSLDLDRFNVSTLNSLRVLLKKQNFIVYVWQSLPVVSSKQLRTIEK